MAWDPRRDFEKRSILRNRRGLKDLGAIQNAEFAALQFNMPAALQMLAREKRIGLASWRRTHRILLSDLYLWAGRLRTVDVDRGGVRFNTVHRIRVETEQVFSSVADRIARARLGEVYGELAFNHPFLDGNGRSLNVVFAELCHRAGFGIAWDDLKREDYLTCLTPAVVAKEYGSLQQYLASHVTPAQDPDERARRLAIAPKVRT